jgi:glycopeptide antibiotics resistance protein
LAQAKKAKKFVAFFFITYSLLLLYWMFFAFSRSRGEEFRYNITPFSTIKNYFTYYDHFPFEIWLMNIAGNIGVFVPFGILIPLLYPKLRNVFFFTFTFLLGITCLETLQLISKLGSFDVDDIILNTCGAVIGLLFLKINRLGK